MLPESYFEQMRTPAHKAKAEYSTEPHSEMLKPYRHDDADFQGIEYLGPGVPGYESPKTPDWWPDGYDDDGDNEGGYYVFSCSHGNDCWCPGETHCFNLDCSQKVIGVNLTWGNLDGRYFRVSGGGDKICIAATQDAEGFLALDINMVAEVREGENIYGEYSGFAVSECTVSECCEAHLAENGDIAINTGEASSTISPLGGVQVAVQGGMGPYKWEISGTGFWLNADHNETERFTWSQIISVYADANAVGYGTLTITDVCGGQVVWYILSTAGNWTLDCDTGYKSPCTCQRGASTTTEIVDYFKYITTYACCLEAGNASGCGAEHATPDQYGSHDDYPPNGYCKTPYNCCACVDMTRVVLRHRVYSWGP